MAATNPYLCVTLSAIPLLIEVQWPFRPAQAGGDFHVVHGKASLLMPGKQELHAKLAINLAVTIIEELPSLEPEVTGMAVVNATRKAVDTRDLEFLKSDKLQPIQISSRHYDFKQKRFRFVTATDDDLRELMLRTAYWSAASGQASVLVEDAIEAEYVGSPVERLRQAAAELAQQGYLNLQGATATATEKLQAMAAQFESAAEAGLQALQEKHAFEARHMK